MPSHKPQSSPGLLDAPPTPIDWPAKLTQLAFFLALILVCARAFMLESLRDPFDPLPGSDAPPLSPGPATSLLLDLLCCIPALLVLLRRAIDPTYILRLAWSHALLFALALWTALSVTWSADRFAALISSANFISALVLLWSATQLVRSWTRLRLVAAAVFGLLLIYLAAGLEYRFLEHPQLVQHWNQNRADILRQQGLEEGSFPALQYEKKLLGGDLGRYANSPNTYAAAIILLATLSLGALFQRLAHRDPRPFTLPILLTLPPAALILYYTHSLTAAITPLIGLALFATIRLLRHWLPTHATLAYWLSTIAIFVGSLALIAHGLYHQSLFLKTLTFRWYYWTGAARLLQQHPLTGVGFANFGLHYPAVRLPLATEEVKDPHNFLVRAFAELGLIGGLLFLTWTLRLWFELTRPITPPTTLPALQPQKRTLRSLSLLALLIAFANFLFTADFTQSSDYLLVQAFASLGCALLLFVGLASLALQSLRHEQLDERPAPWLLYGLLIALALFFLHNLIDFSLFETAPLFLFALLTGSALGVRHPPRSSSPHRPLSSSPHPLIPSSPHLLISSSPLLLALLLWLTAFFTLYLPTALAESASSAADAALRANHPRQAASLYQQAFQRQPTNAHYAYRAAQALAYDPDAPGLQIRGLLQSAIQTNPYNPQYPLFLAAYELHQPTPNPAIVKQAYESALRLNPRHLPTRLAYAQALEKLNDPTSALEQYRLLLAQDASLPPDEPNRLSPTQRRELEQKTHPLSQ